MTGARVWSLGLALSTAGCALTATSVSPPPPGPEAGMQGALSALQHDDFHTATEQLAAVASDCTDGHRARRALLLLAVVELDTSNPGGSPLAAASLSDRYLLLAERGSDEWILARTLYRVATHLETLARRTADADRPVSSTELVDPPGPCGPSEPTDEGLSADEVLLADAIGSPSAPWLLGLESEKTVLRNRVKELEAELERINLLLTSSPAPNAAEPRR